MESNEVKGRFPPNSFCGKRLREFRLRPRGAEEGMPYNRKARRRRGGRGIAPEQRMPEVSAAPPCHSSAFFSPRYT